MTEESYEEIEERFKGKRGKKKKEMKVSGRSVFSLKKIIEKSKKKR